MKILRKTLAMLICIAMCLSFFPATAAWAEGTAEEEAAEEAGNISAVEEEEAEPPAVEENSVPVQEETVVPEVTEVVAENVPVVTEKTAALEKPAMKAAAENTQGETDGQKGGDSGDPDPVVYNHSVSSSVGNINATSATFDVSFTVDSAYTEASFCMAEVNVYTDPECTAQASGGAANVSLPQEGNTRTVTVSSLAPTTVYYYRARLFSPMTGSVLALESEVHSFTTGEGTTGGGEGAVYQHRIWSTDCMTVNGSEKIHIFYEYDMADEVHQVMDTGTGASWRISVFYSTDPNFADTVEGKNNADHLVPPVFISLPNQTEGIYHDDLVVTLNNLTPGATYYYLVELAHQPSSNVILAEEPRGDDGMLKSFTVESVEYEPLSLGETKTGTVFSFAVPENNVYSVVSDGANHVYVKNASGTWLAEDCDTGVHSLFLASQGETVYISATSEADITVLKAAEDKDIAELKLGEPVTSYGRRGAYFVAPEEADYNFTGKLIANPNGGAAVGEIMLANLNTMEWDHDLATGLHLTKGQKIFMRLDNGPPVNSMTFKVTNAADDVSSMINGISETDESIREQMQTIAGENREDLAELMLDRPGSAANTRIAALESAAAGGGSTNVEVDVTQADYVLFTGVTVLGASLNGTLDGGPAALVVGPASDSATPIPAELQYKTMLFSLELQNLTCDPHSGLEFPIAVDFTLVPNLVDTHHLRLYHYQGDSAEPVQIPDSELNVYYNDLGDSAEWHVRIFLTSLSDFAMVYEDAEGGDDPGGDDPYETLTFSNEAELRSLVSGTNYYKTLNYIGTDALTISSSLDLSNYYGSVNMNGKGLTVENNAENDVIFTTGGFEYRSIGELLVKDTLTVSPGARVYADHLSFEGQGHVNLCGALYTSLDLEDYNDQNNQRIVFSANEEDSPLLNWSVPVASETEIVSAFGLAEEHVKITALIDQPFSIQSENLIISEAGSIKVRSTLTVPTGKTLTNNSYIELQNQGCLEINGTLENNGSVTVYNGCSIQADTSNSIIRGSGVISIYNMGEDTWQSSLHVRDESEFVAEDEGYEDFHFWVVISKDSNPNYHGFTEESGLLLLAAQAGEGYWQNKVYYEGTGELVLSTSNIYPAGNGFSLNMQGKSLKIAKGANISGLFVEDSDCLTVCGTFAPMSLDGFSRIVVEKDEQAVGTMTIGQSFTNSYSESVNWSMIVNGKLEVEEEVYFEVLPGSSIALNGELANNGLISVTETGTLSGDANAVFSGNGSIEVKKAGDGGTLESRLPNINLNNFMVSEYEDYWMLEAWVFDENGNEFKTVEQLNTLLNHQGSYYLQYVGSIPFVIGNDLTLNIREINIFMGSQNLIIQEEKALTLGTNTVISTNADIIVGGRLIIDSSSGIAFYGNETGNTPKLSIEGGGTVVNDGIITLDGGIMTLDTGGNYSGTGSINIYDVSDVSDLTESMQGFNLSQFFAEYYAGDGDSSYSLRLKDNGDPTIKYFSSAGELLERIEEAESELQAMIEAAAAEGNTVDYYNVSLLYDGLGDDGLISDLHIGQNLDLSRTNDLLIVSISMSGRQLVIESESTLSLKPGITLRVNDADISGTLRNDGTVMFEKGKISVTGRIENTTYMEFWNSTAEFASDNSYAGPGTVRVRSTEGSSLDEMISGLNLTDEGPFNVQWDDEGQYWDIVLQGSYLVTPKAVTTSWEELDYKPSGGGIYAAGDEVTVSAGPQEGYTFIGWSRYWGEEPGTDQAEYTFTIDSDESESEIYLYAVYEPIIGSANYGYTIKLQDSIDIVYNVKNLKAGTNPSDYSIEYTFIGETRTETLTDQDLNAITVASCAAKEMTEPVTITVRYKDVVIKERVLTIQEYCEKAIRDYSQQTNLVSLCKATLDYGRYAQESFGHNLDDLANGGTDYNNVAGVVIPEATSSKSGECTGITGRSFTLVTESRTQFVVYLKHESTAEIDNYTFLVNGVAVKPEDVSGKYEITITGIAAKSLGNAYTIVVTNNTDGTSQTYTTSPLVYMYKGSAENVVKAMYNYYLAAYAYF